MCFFNMLGTPYRAKNNGQSTNNVRPEWRPHQLHSEKFQSEVMLTCHTHLDFLSLCKTYISQIENHTKITVNSLLMDTSIRRTPL